MKTPMNDLNLYLQAYVDVLTKNGGAVPSTEQIKLRMEELSTQGIAANQAAGGLAGTLQGTKTPFENVQEAINAMMGNLGTGFKSVDAFFTSLAGNLNMTYNATSGNIVAGNINAAYRPSVIYVPYSLVNIGNNDWWWKAIYQGVELSVSKAPNIKDAYGNWVPDPNSRPQPYPKTLGTGGKTSGPSIAGEMGEEWVVPTYEPQRKNFLASAPKAFWDNLASSGSSSQNNISGGSEDITILVPVSIDGNKIAEVTAKYIPRNSNLSTAIRRAAN